MLILNYRLENKDESINILRYLTTNNIKNNCYEFTAFLTITYNYTGGKRC